MFVSRFVSPVESQTESNDGLDSLLKYLFTSVNSDIKLSFFL